MVKVFFMKNGKELFNKKNLLGNDTLQMLFIAPLNLGLGSGLAVLIGLYSSIIGLYTAYGMNGLPAFILGFICLYNFPFMSSIAVIKSILFFQLKSSMKNWF